jgi:uncharacterized protein (DUF1684 family)
MGRVREATVGFLTVVISRKWICLAGGLLVLTVSIPSCRGGDREVPPPPPPGWEDALLAHRGRIHEFFLSSDSPLDPSLRTSFTGLRYFPPDPSYRFPTVPDTRGSGARVTLLDTKGGLRSYVVHSRLHLEKDGQRFTFTVYGTPDSPHLFLPFQDATTGRETYEVGRYLDLTLGSGDTLVVDFNYAINPYCAYADRWACPLVPEENKVAVAIRAGEMAYPRPSP